MGSLAALRHPGDADIRRRLGALAAARDGSAAPKPWVRALPARHRPFMAILYRLQPCRETINR